MYHFNNSSENSDQALLRGSYSFLVHIKEEGVKISGLGHISLSHQARFRMNVRLESWCEQNITSGPLLWSIVNTWNVKLSAYALVLSLSINYWKILAC